MDRHTGDGEMIPMCLSTNAGDAKTFCRISAIEICFLSTLDTEVTKSRLT